MIHRIKPAIKNYIWGGTTLKQEFAKQSEHDTIAETWELSCHKDGESIMQDLGTTLTQYLNENPGAKGKLCDSESDFPVLIKFIDAANDLSIQVHPNDEYAQKNEGQAGKTEMWYVVDGTPSAFLYYGFKKDTTPQEFKKAIEDGTLCEHLNRVSVKKGDVFFIEAGTIHAIGAGCVIAEVQQNSNVTYRVYDYKRTDANGNERELHVEKACEVTNLKTVENKNCTGKHIAKCEYFTVDLINLDKEHSEDTLFADENSFKHLLVVDGEVEVYTKEQSIVAQKGQSVFIDASTGLVNIKGTGDIIVTYIEKPTYRIGIDLGGTNIKVGIVNEDNEIIASHSMPTMAQRTWKLIAADIVKTIEIAAQKAGIKVSDCVSVGMGTPGTVDVAKGTIVYSNNFCDFENIPMQNELETALNKPVKMSNDANCAALGEFAAGAAKEYESVVLVTLGTGVGTGFVLDHKIFEGGGPGGAEGGHTVIVANGESCTCGRKGCFESYASATALVRDALKEIENSKDSMMAQLYRENGNKMNGIIPFKAARANDEAGLKVVNNYIEYLGIGIVNLVNIIRPQVVLISGGISNEKEYLTDKLNAYVKANTYAGNKLSIPEVKTATLGNNAGIVGAANL